MKKISFCMGLLSLLVLVSCEQVPQDDELDLDSTYARLGYAIGLRHGQRMASGDMAIDVDAYIEGFADAMSNTEPRMTEDEIENEIEALQARRKIAAESGRAELAKTNLEDGAAYRDSMMGRDDVLKTESGLLYIVLAPGKGESPDAEDAVEVHYEGKLIDGTVFDSSIKRGKTVTFGLNQVIPGWTEGLQLMKSGAKFQFIIPPHLGYGERGAGQMVGPNATLIFEVELIDIIEPNAD